MKLNMNSPLMDFITTTTHFIGLNILFIFFCLPIITIGPAVAALYQVTLREARGEHGYIIRTFLFYFKEIFLQGLITSLFFAILGLLAAYTIAFWSHVDTLTANIITTISYLFAILILAAAVYAFPLMARFKNSYLQTIKNSFLIALTNLKVTFCLLLIQGLLIAILYLFSQSRIFMLLIGFSFIAFCNSHILSKLFKLFEISLPVAQE